MHDAHNCKCTLTKTLHLRGTKQLKEKPTAVADYNQYMLGVDKMDQFVSYYSFLHKSVKWWRKVFFWTQEVAAVNCYILYRQGEGKRMSSTSCGSLSLQAPPDRGTVRTYEM